MNEAVPVSLLPAGAGFSFFADNETVHCFTMVGAGTASSFLQEKKIVVQKTHNKAAEETFFFIIVQF